MVVKIDKKKRVSVKVLMELIPYKLIEGLTNRFLTDKWVKKLDTCTFFNLLLYSISSERLSLRVMEENFKALRYKQ